MSSTTKVCVPVCAPDLVALKSMTSDAVALGDIVELRLDCLSQDQLHNSSALLSELTRDIDVPIILTLRDPAQGGANSWPRDSRRDFWRTQLLHTESMFDLEYDLVRELAMDQSLMIDWSKVICSHHDFEGVPENLNDIFERLAATPAGVVKIAVAPRGG